jgi:hypothetical protein
LYDTEDPDSIKLISSHILQSFVLPLRLTICREMRVSDGPIRFWKLIHFCVIISRGGRFPPRVIEHALVVAIICFAFTFDDLSRNACVRLTYTFLEIDTFLCDHFKRRTVPTAGHRTCIRCCNHLFCLYFGRCVEKCVCQMDLYVF